MMQKVIAGVLLGAGVVVVIVCLVLGSKHSAFVAHAKETSATITGAGTISKGGRRSRNNPDRWDYTFPVHYAVDGHEYDSQASVHGQDDLPAGSSPERPETWQGKVLPIVYDPAEPTHIEAAAYAKGSNLTWGYSIAGLLVLAGGSRLYRATSASA